MQKFTYSQYFPYKNIRSEQTQSIDFVLDNFITKNKKFVVLELGTGCGKSAIGLTVSRYLKDNLPVSAIFEKGAYTLTTQKVLQEQYMNDFGEPNGLMRSLKSASNYECNFHKQNSCGESLRLLKDEQKGSHFWNSCMNNCNYKIEKRKFMDSKESLTNYSYLLAEMRYSKKT